MPIILNPFLEKKRLDSDPTSPQEPVIRAIFIKKNFLHYRTYLTMCKYLQGYCLYFLTASTYKI